MIDENVRELGLAIEREQLDRCREIVSSFPEVIEKPPTEWETWLNRAIETGSIEIIDFFLGYGVDVDSSPPRDAGALELAVGKQFCDIVDHLLKLSADPNLGRPMIAAISNRHAPENRLRMVKALVEHGCDVNKQYDLYGNPENTFTVLDWTKDPEVVAYLRGQGAKTSDELNRDPRPPLGGEDVVSQVEKFFDFNFGRVDPRALVEIVPTGRPLAINVIRPTPERKHLTLFTTGLSTEPMSVPDGLADFALAELFIQLPGDWPLPGDVAPAGGERAAGDPRWSWPVEWLRRLVQYPHANNASFGGPVTIIANSDPPEPLWPGAGCTSMLLFAEKSFKRTDGRTVQLYRLLPIHSDERELEMRKGAPALFRALDRKSVPFIVDTDRPSVAAKRGGHFGGWFG